MMKTVVEAECQGLNEDKTIPMQEKLTLYLCGLGHLAREIMTETNATDFTASTTLEPKNGGMKVDVQVKVKKSTEKEEHIMNNGMTFEEWLKQLDQVAQGHGQEGSLVEASGKECWEEYFAEGLSPSDAYAEDCAHA